MSQPDPEAEELPGSVRDTQRLQRVVNLMAGANESHLRSFLTSLAVEGDVSPNTQGQAKSAL